MNKWIGSLLIIVLGFNWVVHILVIMPRVEKVKPVSWFDIIIMGGLYYLRNLSDYKNILLRNNEFPFWYWVEVHSMFLAGLLFLLAIIVN